MRAEIELCLYGIRGLASSISDLELTSLVYKSYLKVSWALSPPAVVSTLQPDSVKVTVDSVIFPVLVLLQTVL